MVALIAVSAAVYAIDKPYSYRIPAGCHVLPGMRVIVPFGRGNRKSEGLVLELKDTDEEGLKQIEAVLDEEPVLSPAFLRMAAFMRERYFCTFYDAAKSMLPAGLWFSSEEVFSLSNSDFDVENMKKSQPEAAKILQFLADLGGNAAKNALFSAVPDREMLEKSLDFLKKRGYLHANFDYNRKVKDKSEVIVTLISTTEEASEYANRKKRSAPLHHEVLSLLCAVGTGSAKEICYLTGATMATIRRLEALGFVALSTRPVSRNAFTIPAEAAEPVVLNPAQQAVYDGLLAQKSGVSLLYGVTGSGKTAVYLRLIRSMLDVGKSSILLVPEIALTPQLVQLLMSHFGSEVAVLHSALRVGERYDEWKRIRQGKARVVVGTRSAVFAPVSDLGLLIVDEEQEHTYKSENSPRYHAREIAIYRGSKEQALVLLGSATPSLESMYAAKQGTYSLYQLPDRFNGKALPKVELVDLKQELKNGNAGTISVPLRDAIGETISAGEQCILFLNRRGSHRCMICVDCGEVPMCPRCSVSLTYHSANGRLMCHHCGFSQPGLERCPHCGGHLKAVGSGTQQIEQELRELFPDTEILRMDADTISATNSHEALLERFRKKNIPILLGTQMVTKGLNFENVTLVGVLNADMSLYVNHFRAAETTFSMLTQVVGRSGRGIKLGRAIIQTMTPEHSVIRLAARQEYDRFYELEISLRSLQKAPPFSDIFTIMFVGLFEAQTVAAAGFFRQQLDLMLQNPMYRELWLEVYGPSPAPVAKINHSYRYRVILHGSNQRPMRQLLAHLLQIFAKDKISKGVTAYVDVNAYE